MSPSTDLTSQYKLEQVLSWTGLGRTFRGQHPDSGAPVAVKVLSLARTPGSDLLGQRFLMTARVLSSLNHHTLPEVLNYGMSSTGDAFLVTAWFEGEVLTRMVPIEPRELLALVVQLTQGLESLALHGLVHLNLSPDNILINDGRPRLTGWGHSLLTVDWQSDPGPPDSQPNAFTAPELCESRKVGDALWRADLYSLGAITASLLGAELQRTKTGTQVKFQRSLSQQLQQPELLRGVLERCLLTDAEGRLDSYSELARAIQHAMPRGRGADRNVSDTQPLERIRPQDVEQVARRLEREEQGGAAAASVVLPGGGEPRVGDSEGNGGSERGLFDLRELNPEMDEATPTIDPDMAQEIAARIDAAGRETETPPEVLSEDAGPSQTVPATEAETMHTRSVRLPASSSSNVKGIDRTLIMGPLGGDFSNVDPDLGVAPPPPPGIPQSPETDPSAPSVGADAAPADPGPATSSSRAASEEVSTGEIRQAEDPTVMVGSDAVKAIRSGVLPTKTPTAPAERVMPDSSVVRVNVEKPRTGEIPVMEPPPPASDAPATSANDTAAGSDGRSVEAESPPAAEPPPEPSAPPPASTAEAFAELDSVPPRSSPAASAASAQPKAQVPPPGETVPPPVTGDGPAIPKWVLGAGVAAVLLFVALGIYAISRLLGGSEEPDQVADVAPPVEVALPEPPPEEEAEEEPVAELPSQLVDAIELFVQDDLLAARGAIDELEAMQEEGELDAAACATFRALAESVLLARVESVESSVRRELRRGRLDPLRRVLGTVSTSEAEALASRRTTADLLASANRAVAAVEEFEQAMRSEDADLMLESSESLRITHPRFEQEQRARDRAADWVAASADEMAANGQLEEALRRLERLQSMRPDRREVIDKMTSIEGQLRSQARFDTLAASIERTSNAGRPSEGLDMLRGVAIPAAEQARFDGLRTRLQRELRDLDSGAPTIRRTTADELEFRKDDPLRFPLEIRDDYQLVRAELTVRDSEGTVTAFPLVVENGVAMVEITPSLHGGRDVELWITATDLSGNVGQLGSRDQPIEGKRRRWYRR